MRLSIPISWKVKKAGEPEFPSPRYPMGEVTLEDYLKTLQNSDFIWANYYKVLQYDESLYGVSLGYDYNYSLGKYLSLFAGADFAYNHLQINAKYYNINYGALDENGMSELGTTSFEKYRKRFIGYSIKPLVGLRLNFQKLMFEASLGYMIVKSNFFYNSNVSSIQIVDKETIRSDYPPDFTEISSDVKYFMYNFSLYYSF